MTIRDRTRTRKTYSFYRTPPVVNTANMSTCCDGPFAMGGDVINNSDNCTVVKIQGTPVSGAVPTTGDVLKFDGTNWHPAPESGGTFTGSIAMGGDVSGSSSACTVVGLQTVDVDPALPFNGDILRYNGRTWSPYTLSITGDVTGSLSGTLTVTGIQGNPVTSSAPSTGDVLTWNGTNCAPTPSTGGTPDDRTVFHHWARRAGIIWTPTGPAGNYTTGTSFKLYTPLKIIGAAAWVVSSGAGTRRVSIWSGSILAYTEDFSVSNGTNYQEFTFATPVTASAGDLGALYTVGIWDTSAGVYTKVNTTPPADYTAKVAGSYFEWTQVDLFGSGDVRPTFGGATECYPVEPRLGLP